jgi:hypothetical protein
VGVALAVHSLSEPRVPEEFHASGLKHAGSNALEHMRLGLPLEDHAVDGVEMQQMGQKKAGRPAADNRDPSAAHFRSSLPFLLPAQRELLLDLPVSSS